MNTGGRGRKERREKFYVKMTVLLYTANKSRDMRRKSAKEKVSQYPREEKMGNWVNKTMETRIKKNRIVCSGRK